MHVVCRLAESPTSEVLLVEATPAGARRVVKRLRKELAGTAAADSFRAFGALAIRLVHPNVVRTIEHGEEDGVPWVAMEWLDGIDLRAVMKRTRVSAAVACAIGARVARGLSYVHGLPGGGVVHRDVSPHNVFLTKRGEVKLLDFDIAVPISHTTAPRIEGKLAYMAPEQLDGLTVDERTDLFGLGVILWELLTGQRLWKRGSEAETVQAIREGSVLPPSAVDARLPSSVDPITMALLAKFACSRPECGADVADALDALVKELGIPASLVPLAIAEAAAQAMQTQAGDERLTLY